MPSDIPVTNNAKFHEGDQGVYLHIGDGGVLFAVTNERGPTLRIESRSFGNNDTVQKIFTNRESLRALASYLFHAADADFDEPYCYAANWENRVSQAADSGK